MKHNFRASQYLISYPPLHWDWYCPHAVYDKIKPARPQRAYHLKDRLEDQRDKQDTKG